MVRFFNTLGRRVDELSPLEAGHVRMYTCGPTVYNVVHIGNLRTFLFEDVLRRHLLASGLRVTQIMNLTDVDDKTIRGAAQAGQKLDDFTAQYIEAFFKDIAALGIEKAERYPRATEHIPEMIAMIEKLRERGYTYEADGSVYFRIASFPGYGKLSQIDLTSTRRGERVADDEYEKEDVKDFVLWKAAKPGEPTWPSPFGPGRPGWHIECSAMSMKYLGEHFDIHTGAVDNIFPHHENEIAQSEGATGHPFVNLWMHAEHLIVDGEKMAKSKGNFFTLADVLAKRDDPAAVRYLFLSVPYRKKLNFTWDGLAGAAAAVARVRTAAARLDEIAASGKTSGGFPAAERAARLRPGVHRGARRRPEYRRGAGRALHLRARGQRGGRRAHARRGGRVSSEGGDRRRRSGLRDPAEGGRGAAGGDRVADRRPQRRPQAPRFRRGRPHPQGARRQGHRARGRPRGNEVEEGVSRVAAAFVLLLAAASSSGQTTPAPRAEDLVPKPSGPATQLGCRRALPQGARPRHRVRAGRLPLRPGLARERRGRSRLRAPAAGSTRSSPSRTTRSARSRRASGTFSRAVKELSGRSSRRSRRECRSGRRPISSREGVAPRALALIRLDRLLLAAALSAERRGRTEESARFLEASWSIFESFARGSQLIDDLLAIAVMKMQSGTLRKLREPPVSWLDRLSRDDPWTRALDTYEEEPKSFLSSSALSNLSVRARKAAAEPLRHVAPCALAEVSNDEIARPMIEEYRRTDSGGDSAEMARIMTDMQVPQLRNVLERAGRSAIDSELTSKILELRLARAGSRDGKWPANLEDDASRACPGERYVYRRTGSSIEIAFQGKPPSSESGLNLPLSFSTRADRRAVAPTASPMPAPTATPPSSN